MHEPAPGIGLEPLRSPHASYDLARRARLAESHGQVGQEMPCAVAQMHFAAIGCRALVSQVDDEATSAHELRFGAMPAAPPFMRFSIM